jgi:uncharacterized membrane protein
MSCLHGLEAVLAYCVIGARWNPASGLLPAVLPNQWVDAVIALVIAVLRQVW